MTLSNDIERAWKLLEDRAIKAESDLAHERKLNESFTEKSTAELSAQMKRTRMAELEVEVARNNAHQWKKMYEDLYQVELELRAERDEARKNIGPGAYGKNDDGTYNICLGYHPQEEQYEWLVVVPEWEFEAVKKERDRLADIVERWDIREDS
jgi:hypothetical protein